MLKTYEVTIKNGQVMWLDEKPQVSSACGLITILEDTTAESIDAQDIRRRRFPISALVGKVKILGDMVCPKKPRQRSFINVMPTGQTA